LSENGRRFDAASQRAVAFKLNKLSNGEAAGLIGQLLILGADAPPIGRNLLGQLTGLVALADIRMCR
jgi:hypothetical protein